MTIRARLALGYAAALAATIAVLASVVWWQQGEDLLADLDRRLQAELRDLVTTIRTEGPPGVSEPDDQPDPIFDAVLDGRGALVIAAPGTPGDLALSPLAAGVFQRDLAGGPYRIHAASVDEDLLAVVGTSLVPVRSAQASLGRSVLVAGTVATLLSVVGGWWLAGRAMAPVARLTSDAAAIGASDLDRRLPDADRHDELGLLARTLNAMLDRIAASVARQRTFLAAASHDLRTPVTTLAAELELVDRPDAHEEELRGAVRAARADATRLGDLTAGLLDLVSAGPEGRALVRAPVPVADLVAAVVRHVSPVATSHGVGLRATAQDATVLVDRVRVEQAMRNVVTNAISWTPRDGEVTIEARMAETASGDRALRLDTLDRGPGIPPDQVERLFQPFVRGTGAPGPGSGLGLATARAAITAHGGIIEIVPRAGGGTIVSMTIPVGARVTTSGSG